MNRDKLLFTLVGRGPLFRNGKELGIVRYRINIYDSPGRPDALDGKLEAESGIDLTDFVYQEITVRVENGQSCDCQLIEEPGEIVGRGRGLHLPDLEREAIYGIEETVHWHTCGIVSSIAGEQGKGIGTGTAIRFQDQHLILTAAHVIEDTPPEKLWFFFRPEGTIQRAEVRKKDDFARQVELYERSSIEISDIKVDKQSDVGLIFVRPDLEQKQRIRFFPLDPNAQTPADERNALVIGHPSDLSIVVGVGNLAVFPSTQWTQFKLDTNTADTAAYLQEFDIQKHFLVDFTNAWFDARHARGFSGAAIWYRRGPIGKDVPWQSNVDIGGLMTHYYEKKRYLKGLRMKAVLESMEKLLLEK